MIIKIYKKIIRHPAIILLFMWYSFAWSWSLFTDTLELAGSQTQGLILTLFVVTINVGLSVLIMWKFIKLVAYIQKKYSTPIFLLSVILIFAIADFLVAWLVALIWIGPQANIDNVLPLGTTALLLADTPFRYASRFVGFYGLAAFVWTTVYLIYDKKVRKYSLLPLLLLTTLSIAGWIIYKMPNGSSTNVTIISEELNDRVPPVNPENTDIVVFPEYGLDKIDNSSLKERIKRTDDNQPKTYLLGSDQVYISDTVGHKNNMRFGNTLDGFTSNQDKYRLIPGGEDLPYVVRTLLRATKQKDTLDYFSSAKGVLKGPAQLKPFSIPDGTKVAAAVCSSVIAPQDYRDFTLSGATIFTNSASLTTFQGSPIFSWEQKNLARLMATANSRYFLQSANASSAYALDNNGNQLIEVKGTKTATVKAINNTAITPYTRIGEWMVWMGALLLIIFTLNTKRFRLQFNKLKNNITKK